MQVAFEGHLKAQQVTSCCSSAQRKSFLPVCHAEPFPHAAILCVLPFPSTHTSSRGMATNCRSCCSGGRGTRTEPSWATRPWQWESSTWLRYISHGNHQQAAGDTGESLPHGLPVPALGRGLGWQAGAHCCQCSGLLAGYNTERWAASCHCVTPSQLVCLCLCLSV